MPQKARRRAQTIAWMAAAGFAFAGTLCYTAQKRKGEGQMESAALIVEGGGMRGVYAAGVMDFFLDKKHSFAAADFV